MISDIILWIEAKINACGIYLTQMFVMCNKYCKVCAVFLQYNLVICTL